MIICLFLFHFSSRAVIFNKFELSWVKGTKVVDLYSASKRSVPKALSTHCQGITEFYLYTPCVSSASGMRYICLCLLSRSWYSFTDHGGMEGWVVLGAKYPRPRFEPATSRLQIRHSTTQPLAHVFADSWSKFVLGTSIRNCRKNFKTWIRTGMFAQAAKRTTLVETDRPGRADIEVPNVLLGSVGTQVKVRWEIRRASTSQRVSERKTKTWIL